MTYHAFEQQMERLQGLRFAPSTLRTHWEHLQDVPEDVLAAAIDKARDESGEFPSPKMLKVYAEQVRPRFVKVPEEAPQWTPSAEPQPPIHVAQAKFTIPTGDRIWRYYCEDCGDQGWRSYWCGAKAPERYPWMSAQHCGRHGDRVEAAHYEHEWSPKCACHDSNPAVQRRLERQRQSGRRGDNE